MHMSLHPRAVLYFMLQSLAFWIFLSIWLAFMVAGSSQSGPQEPAMVWGFVARLCVWTLFILATLSGFNWGFCFLKARAYHIEITREGIALDYGILNKTHEILLFDKIQNILIYRSIVERLLGLSTVIIQNAMGQPEKIPGLGDDVAISFRDTILTRLRH